MSNDYQIESILGETVNTLTQLSFFSACMWYNYNGDKNPGIHPGRWRAIVAQIRKEHEVQWPEDSAEDSERKWICVFTHWKTWNLGEGWSLCCDSTQNKGILSHASWETTERSGDKVMFKQGKPDGNGNHPVYPVHFLDTTFATQQRDKLLGNTLKKAICGNGSFHLWLTSDPTEITCEHCRKHVSLE